MCPPRVVFEYLKTRLVFTRTHGRDSPGQACLKSSHRRSGNECELNRIANACTYLLKADWLRRDQSSRKIKIKILELKRKQRFHHHRMANLCVTAPRVAVRVYCCSSYYTGTIENHGSQRHLVGRGGTAEGIVLSLMTIPFLLYIQTSINC